ncbi:hypothetical protein, partial [Rhodobium orientis]
MSGVLPPSFPQTPRIAPWSYGRNAPALHAGCSISPPDRGKLKQQSGGTAAASWQRIRVIPLAATDFCRPQHGKTTLRGARGISHWCKTIYRTAVLEWEFETMTDLARVVEAVRAFKE